MGAEGWKAIARNSNSSSFGPFSTSQRVVCGLLAVEFIKDLFLRPLIQESDGLRTPQACPAISTLPGVVSSTLRGSAQDSKDFSQFDDHMSSRDCMWSGLNDLRSMRKKGKQGPWSIR